MTGTRNLLQGMSPRTKVAGAVVAVSLLLAAVGTTSLLGQAQAPGRFKTVDEAVAAGAVDQRVADTLRSQGSVTALLEVRAKDVLDRGVALAPKGRGRAAAILEVLKPELARRKAAILAAHPRAVEKQRYEALPLSLVEVTTEAELLGLVNEPDVVAIREDRILKPSLAQSRTLIKADTAQVGGTAGAGTYVAVLDTGVDYRRTAFGCTAPGVPATCRVAFATDTAPNDSLLDRGNFHGTNVSGIVAGTAPGAKILNYDVFTWDAALADDRAQWSDINEAVNDLILKLPTMNIVAFNLSVGTDAVYTPAGCPGDIVSVTYARSMGVLPVISAGNEASSTGMGYPGCIADAVSVGAVYDANVGSKAWAVGCTDSTTVADKIVCFSNSSQGLTLLAPGSVITAADISMSGTSQAAPHVAGAAAILAAYAPNATVDQLETALATTGKAITDPRNGIVRKRLDVAAAMASLLSDTTIATKPANPSNQAATFSFTASIPGATFECALDTTVYAPCTSPANLGTIADGSHTFRVRAVVAAGPDPSPASYAWTVDRTAPVFSAQPYYAIMNLQMVNATTVPISIRWTAADGTGSGIASYELRQDTAKAGTFPTAIAVPAGTAQGTASAAVNGTYAWRVRATDKAGNVSAWQTGPNVLVAMYQETNGDIAYTSGWALGTSTSYIGGNDRYSSTTNAKATFTARNARNVAWVTYKSSARGQARIIIDGVTTSSLVNTYVSGTAVNRFIAMHTGWLDPLVPHPVAIQVYGTAGHPRVDIDAFIILHDAG